MSPVDPVATFVPELLKLGFAGVVIFALAWAVLRLSNRLDAVQEKRIAENRESITTMSAMTTAVEGLTEWLKEDSRRRQ